MLIRWDTFFVLNFRLYIVDSIARFNFQGDGFTSECFDEDLHTTTETEDKVESGLFLDIIVRKGAAVFKLLTSEDKALLIWGNAFLVLDL